MDKKELRVQMPDDVRGGIYSNNMIIQHTREEFILDFMMMAPPEGRVNARVIVSPSHAKRIFEALRENLTRYEQNYGPIKAAEAPKTFL